MAVGVQPIPEKLMNFLLEKVAPILKAETQKILNVPALVESIRNERDIANDFLKKTEKRAERADDWTKKRVWELRELVFKIEDCLDDYEMLLEKDENERKQGISNEILQGASSIVVGFESKHGIARKIGRVKRAMEKIKDGKSYEESIFTRAQINESDSENENEQQFGKGKKPLLDPANYPLDKEEKELVGFKKRKKDVIDKLDLNKEICEKGQSVLAVWGEPGVGKTTLAQKVYEDEDVRKCFACHAWITATKPYKKVDLLTSLYNQLAKNSQINSTSSTSTAAASITGKPSKDSTPKKEELLDNEVTISKRLRSYLLENGGKNGYLVVLDDVSEMGELSKIIKGALLPSQDGKLLITTRSESIANYWKTISSHGKIYNLQILSKHEAGNLFDKEVFGYNKKCPSNLKRIKANVVPECDGLPFLIESVGAIFSTKVKWIDLYHNFQLNPLLPKDRNVFLSRYYEMPHHLKLCFLYLCMFPKDYKLARMRIIRLWIAEGFVEAIRHFTCEEAAKEYLGELVERGMVRCLETDDTGRSRIFQVPNMWRRIMLPKLADLSFCQVVNEENSFRTNNKNGCRRLSISEENLKNFVIAPSVRSILSFTNPTNFPLSWPPPFKESAFRLKVLDLQNAQFHILPDQIGYLHNLRYLSLRKTRVKKLPHTIDGLLNLQTLDLKHTFVTKLPKGINRLSKLRHLLVYRYRPEQSDYNDVEGKKTTSIEENSTIYDRVKKLFFSLVCCCQNREEKKDTMTTSQNYNEDENTRTMMAPVEIQEGILDDFERLQRLQFIDESSSNNFEMGSLENEEENNYKYMKNIPMKIEKGMLDNFEQLQKLAFVDGCSSYFLEGLGKLKQLRRLGIVNLRQSYAKKFCEVLEGMKELRALSIKNEEMIIDLTHVQKPPEYLERLYLDGPLEGKQLPNWIINLKHLLKVRLVKSKFDPGFDPISHLNKMKFLLVLEIDTYGVESLNFGEKGFKNLQVLRIKDVNCLMKIKAGDSTLPKLQKFVCDQSSNVQNIEGIPLRIIKALLTKKKERKMEKAKKKKQKE